MKAIYSSTPLEEWVSVAELLYNQEGIFPSYWVCTGDVKEKVEERFPDTIVHDSIDCIQGRCPKEYDREEVFFGSIDEEFLNNFSEYEAIALKMMDRLDGGRITGSHFTYNERVRHYHRLLMYWKEVVDDIDPEVVFFGSTPHLVSDFILYCVADYKDIDTVILTPTSIQKRFYSRKGLTDIPAEIPDTFDGSEVSKNVRDHLNKLRGSYDEAEPDYMESRDLRSYITNFKKYPKYARKLIGKIYRLRDHASAYVKKKDKLIEDSVISNLEWFFYRQKAKYYKKNLKKVYQTYSENPQLNNSFIYIPLHYQPERTTSPEGGQYVHQYIMVKMLSEAVPDGVKLYVKEHPSQFNSSLKGEQGRNKTFYNDLDSISNLKFVPIDMPSFELIDNSVAVATSTGTAGWEALARQKPVLAFGSAWYKACHGCYSVKNDSELKEAIKEIWKRGASIEEEDIMRFLSYIEDITHQGDVVNESESSDKKSNVDAIYKSLKDSFEKV